MSENDDDLFEDTLRTTPRVLPLISNQGNRTQLTDWLTSHESLEYVPFEGDLSEAGFDVCILDEVALRQYQQELASLKEEAEPVIVPYLLLLPEFGETHVDFEGEDLVDAVTPASVDEIASLPIKQQELEWRVRSLLRLRNQSIRGYTTGRRYHSLFESIRDAILVTDTDRKIVDCNQAFTDLFGYTLPEIASKPTHTVYESKAEFEEMGEAIQGHIGDPEFTKIVSYERKSGDVFPGETNVFYLQDRDGEIHGFIGMIRDVSVRLERERELQQYEAAVEGSTDMLLAADRDRRVLFANERARSLFGRTEEKIQGVHLSEILAGEEYEAIDSRFERALDGQEGQFLYEASDDENRTRILDVHYYPLKDESTDEITGVVMAVRDVTDSERRKRKLREFEQAVNAAGHAIYMTDPEGEIKYANQAFEEITGYSPQEAIGENPRILKSGKMPAAYYETLWETVTSGEIWEEEVTNRRKNGELYHAHQTIAPVTNEAGDVEGFVAIQTDITDRKERHEHLLAIDRMLRHNLNSEMNIVLGWASMIEEAGTGELAEYAASIIEASERLLGQAAKEREIVRILTEPLTRTTLDLTQQIRSVTTQLQDEYPDAVFDLDLPAELEISTIPEIERAVSELLENAIVHAADEPASVRVGLTETGDGVELEIVDTNSHIPAEELAVLTGDSQIDALTHVSGMGLWLVKRIVRRADGKMTFERTEPTGNRITIALPT